MTAGLIDRVTGFPLILGGNTFGWTSDEEASFAVLDAYVAAGGSLVDTADVYSAWAPGHRGGESERMIGRWLAARGRDRISVMTKAGRHPELSGLARSTVLAAAEASRERLGVERIDVYLAHYDDPEQPIEAIAETFHELVERGWVAEIGVSNAPAERIEAWAAIAEERGLARPRYLQPHYNLVHRRAFETALRPVAERHGLAVIPYFALASGFLAGKYRTPSDVAASPRNRYAAPYLSPEGLVVVDLLGEIAGELGAERTTVALAWLCAQPTVLAPIASARTPEQLDALAAVARVRLTPEQLARLDEASAAVGGEA